MSSTIEASFYLKNIENMFHGIINYSGLQNTRIHENLAFLNWLQQQDFHSSFNEGITVNNTCSLAIIKYWLTVVVVQEIDSMKNTIDQKFEYLTNDKLTSSLMSLWHKLRGCGVSIEAFQGYDDGSIRNACRTKAFDSYSKAQHFKLCMDIRLSWGIFFLLQALSSNICCKLESFRNSLDIDYPPMKEILRDCWTVFRYKTDLMRSLIERAQNGLLQILAGWKWQSRFYSEESQFPSEFKENLRDIHAGIKNILEVHRIFLSVNQEVMNLLSQLNNKDVLEELDICHRNLQYITSLHDQLIMRSFFVMIHCSSASKFENFIKCTTVFLANEKCSIIQPINTAYDGFETRNHEKSFSPIEMTLEQLGDRQYCIGKFKERFANGKRDKNVEELPYVTDYRCQLIFSCNVQTCLGTTVAMECKSKPFALLTGGNQLARADAGVAWDIHLIPDTDLISAGSYFPYEPNMPWYEVEKMLEFQFHYRVKKSLSAINLQYIKFMIFGKDPVTVNDNELVNRDIFVNNAKVGLADRYSVGEWIFMCLEAISKPVNLLSTLWKEGNIIGFISKAEAESILQSEPIGTCLIRFSEKSPGNLTVPYKDAQNLIRWTKPENSLKRSWIDE